MAVNFTKNQDEIIKAWRDVVDSKDSSQWALFGYEGTTNNIKLMSTGSNGLDELVHEFNCSLIQYAFCRVLDKGTAINKLVLINWQGESAPLSRKGLCASHVGDVANYFKGCTQTITIRNDDEATTEYLMEQILRTSFSKVSLSRQVNDDTPVENAEQSSNPSSSYKKVDARSEIAADRKSFWQRQEEEEKERLVEEKKRAAERQAQFEKERKLREESEAKKLAEAVKERDRIIEATRQAERQESSSGGSQPSSILSTNANQDNDDGRVGRRSELIRLERNQETQSLISKGLIKNKRAIFEQASQQQQQQKTSSQPTGGVIARRPSGTIITQRLNTFQTLESGTNNTTSDNDSSSATVEKLTNGFSDKLVLDSQAGNATKSTAIKKEIESVKITKSEKDSSFSPSVMTPTATTESVDNKPIITTNIDATHTEIVPTNEAVDVIKANQVQGLVEQNGNGSNGNAEPKTVKDHSPSVDSDRSNGNNGISAKALYDYQAADRTEISFDPDDIIGCIEKVDAGWWHGTVLTGQYKNQAGLFPSNYVEELQGFN